jgi:hypothetical protein
MGSPCEALVRVVVEGDISFKSCPLVEADRPHSEFSGRVGCEG